MFPSSRTEKKNNKQQQPNPPQQQGGGCGALLSDAEAFASHCGEVEHDDDFAYETRRLFLVKQKHTKTVGRWWPPLVWKKMVKMVVL